MERFGGVFICTTNLMDRIDQAALRRFAFKLQFQPLTLDQRIAMFVRHALAGLASELTPEHLDVLRGLDHLCLGDFSTVMRQAEILGVAWDPPSFLQELKAEHKIKPHVRSSRPVGFLSPSE
jgi:SpoVK/Ycf46/Vps4 family AAA+-type ATPase